jgi:hypothetical protein
MNGPEQKLDAPAEPRLEEVQEELYFLRTLLSVSLIFMIALSLSVDLYLLKQVSMQAQQVANAQKAEDSFNAAKAADRASEVWSRLVEYSKTHPDYVPVLARFSPALNQTMITSVPAARH